MNGLQLQLEPNVQSTKQSIRMCQAIAELSMFYDGFEKCSKSSDVRQCVQETITNLEWGAYYDGGKLPANILKELTGPPSEEITVADFPIDSPQVLKLPDFPALTSHNPTSENQGLLISSGPAPPLNRKRPAY